MAPESYLKVAKILFTFLLIPFAFLLTFIDGLTYRPPDLLWWQKLPMKSMIISMLLMFLFNGINAVTPPLPMKLRTGVAIGALIIFIFALIAYGIAISSSGKFYLHF